MRATLHTYATHARTVSHSDCNTPTPAPTAPDTAVAAAVDADADADPVAEPEADAALRRRLRALGSSRTRTAALGTRCSSLECNANQLVHVVWRVGCEWSVS